MKQPIILEGQPFDWDPKTVEKVVNRKGDTNWRAAFSADPGVMKCPGCSIYLWREGTRVRCPDCGFEWVVK